MEKQITKIRLTLSNNQQVRRNMVSRWLPCILAAVMIIAVAPAFAGGKATQMWRCEMDDDATEEQVMKAAQKWLTAARKVKGGENLEASVYFPVAVSNNGETDVIFVITAPTFKDWGKFWDGYGDSEAGNLDEENKGIITPTDSGLWESIKVKSPTSPKSSGKVVQIWRCELDDDGTEAQVKEAAKKWLAAAKTMAGGKDLEAYVLFPVAVNDSGQSDLFFVINAPSFEAWGEFWDGYEGSAAANLDKADNGIISPTDSALWESVKVEAAE